MLFRSGLRLQGLPGSSSGSSFSSRGSWSPSVIPVSCFSFPGPGHPAPTPLPGLSPAEPWLQLPTSSRNIWHMVVFRLGLGCGVPPLLRPFAHLSVRGHGEEQARGAGWVCLGSQREETGPRGPRPQVPPLARWAPRWQRLFPSAPSRAVWKPLLNGWSRPCSSGGGEGVQGPGTTKGSAQPCPFPW